MERIRVKVGAAYEVLLGSGLLDSIGLQARRINQGKRVLLVTDETVCALYQERAVTAFRAGGYQTQVFTVTPGEGAKTASCWLSLLQQLADGGYTRSDLIAALGGGTVSDLAGFAAAAYLRGVDYMTVPTTLLAMVDASIGGKTGIDLPQGKNLVGAFHQPRLVVCDPDTLQTLPQNVLSDGFAEMIKYGMIGDEALLTRLRSDFAPQAERLIGCCIAQKSALVVQDERDTGIRRLLNFGHTIGHAIEARSEFRISHGKAVAIGMAAMTKLAEHTGDCADGVYWELCDLLTAHGLPVQLPYSAAELWQAAFADKKRQGDTISLVLPIRRGQCRIRNCSMDDWRTMLEACEAL